MRSKVLAVALLALVAWSCHQVILTAPLDSTMTLIANPPFISANGGRATITAVVIEPIGTPVADGTVVQFETTLGRIDEQGKTNDGVARVNLVGDGRSGTARILAFSGAATATLEGEDAVVIGNASATQVQVSADPERIRANDPRTSRITATALDANGNFLQGVPVRFSTSSPTSEEIDTKFQFTDTNGQVSATMRTRHPRDAEQKVVTVTATTANGVTGDTTVTVN